MISNFLASATRGLVVAPAFVALGGRTLPAQRLRATGTTLAHTAWVAANHDNFKDSPPPGDSH